MSTGDPDKGTTGFTRDLKTQNEAALLAARKGKKD